MIRVADLFAGAGGCSTGLLQAATQRGERVELVAINHWPIAVETHTRNHPEAKHFCASVETLNPITAVPSGRLDLLIAAPECVFFSTARGGKPIDDQRRASAWAILRWLEHLRVDELLIENVPEMRDWGPLGATHKPLKSKKGETFRAFIRVIESLNYRVEWKVLNAADYGAATTRRRLFIRARRGGKAIHWPASTHSKTGQASLFGGVRKWRAAREIIDWSLPSQSIFTRKIPLKPATIRRILEGLRRFGGPQLEPFLVILRNHATGQSIEGPIPTVTGGGTHTGIAEPVIVKLTHGDRARARAIDEPLPTLTAANRGELGIVEPFIVQPAHGVGAGRGDRGRVTSVESPLGTQPASNRFALAEPFLVPLYSERDGQRARVHSVDEPVPVIPASGDGKFGIVEPFVLQQQSGGLPRPVDQPAPTIAADGAIGLVEPFIVPPRHMNDGGVDSVDAPLRTVTAVSGHVFGVVEPFLTKYNRTAIKAKSVDDPLETVSTRDRFALVQPVINGYALDIRFRMLQPHELSAAMSFPQSYVFTGNKGDQIRQIGNAVDCRMAEALCGAILDARTPTRRKDEAVA